MNIFNVKKNSKNIFIITIFCITLQPILLCSTSPSPTQLAYLCPIYYFLESSLSYYYNVKLFYKFNPLFISI